MHSNVIINFQQNNL